MAISTGARASIGYITEVTWGTTPAAPALVELPFVSFSVNKSIAKHLNPSITGNRQYLPSVSGNVSVAGDLDVAYQPLNHDVLLESLLNSTWLTSVLKPGSIRKSFTLEHSQIDADLFFQYTGVIVDKLALKLDTSGIVTAKFSLLGKDSPTVTVNSIDTVAGTGTGGFSTAALASIPFVHNGGTFKEGGAAFASFVSLDLTLENKAASNFALGSSTVRDFTVNFFEVNGTANVYFEDAVMYNKFILSTASSLEFTLNNGTNTHNYLLPNIRYNGANKTITGNGPVVMAMPFTGFYDATNVGNLKITKT